MKTVIAVVLSLAALSGCSNALQHVGLGPKMLSDNFATNALLALKTMESDNVGYGVSKNVYRKQGLPIDRATQEKIDGVDALAVTDQEKRITDTLNHVYAAKVRFNWQVFEKDSWLKAVSLDEDVNERFKKDKTRLKKKGLRDEQAYNAEHAKEWSEAVLVASGKLATCFSEFDASLRARSTIVPVSCGHLDKPFPLSDKESAEYDYK
jgi:hypothetical protein